MERFIRNDDELRKLFGKPEPGGTAWILSPNTAPVGSAEASRSAHHGDFDDDEATVKATLARILGQDTARAEVTFQRTASSRIHLRQRIAE